MALTPYKHLKKLSNLPTRNRKFCFIFSLVFVFFVFFVGGEPHFVAQNEVPPPRPPPPEKAYVYSSYWERVFFMHGHTFLCSFIVQEKSVFVQGDFLRYTFDF